MLTHNSNNHIKKTEKNNYLSTNEYTCILISMCIVSCYMNVWGSKLSLLWRITWLTRVTKHALLKMGCHHGSFRTNSIDSFYVEPSYALFHNRFVDVYN